VFVTVVAFSLQMHPCQARPQLDLRLASFAGVVIDTSIVAVRRSVGTQNVRRHMVNSEGGPEAAYRIRLCGHWVDRMSDQVRWTDSAFADTHGLGVNAPLVRFDSILGQGSINADQGLSVAYSANGRTIYTEVGEGCIDLRSRPAVLNRSCRVTAINMMLRTSP
jgi:hypothetical protein